MARSLKKFISFILLLAMLAIQAHVILHERAHSTEHAKGKTHTECQLCATVLTQKTLSPVCVPRLAPVSLPFEVVVPSKSQAASHAATIVHLLRGPPASLPS
jgi:hypothetical protein